MEEFSRELGVFNPRGSDALPLYRQETITRRFGIPLVRLTLCHWMLDLVATLQELHQVMITEGLRSRVLHTFVSRRQRRHHHE